MKNKGKYSLNIKKLNQYENIVISIKIRIKIINLN